MRWVSFSKSERKNLSLDKGLVFRRPISTADIENQLVERLNDSGSRSAIPTAFLALAGDVADLFEITPPDAPGVCFVGAMTQAYRHCANPHKDILSAGACGLTFRDAFLACMGEATERLAQAAARPEAQVTPSAEIGVGLSPERREDLFDLLAPQEREGLVVSLAAFNLSDGSCLRAPASLCIRAPGVIAHVNPSTGCACGIDAESAILSGLFECVERDAVALWWHAGRPARILPMEILEAAGLDDLIPLARQGQRARRSWALDITSDLGVPCVAFVSVTSDGDGFAHGAAARPTLAAARPRRILGAVPDGSRLAPDGVETGGRPRAGQ